MAKLISYDLCVPGQDYETLINEIKKFPRWCKLTESCWIVNTPLSCVKIRDHLMQFIDKNDRIAVVTLTDEAAWSNILCKNEYLKTSLNQP